MYFFFLKKKTAYERRISDWSSDVCSSDLADDQQPPGQGADAEDGFVGEVAHVAQAGDVGHVGLGAGCDQGLVEAQPDAVAVEVGGGLEHGMAGEKVDGGPPQHPWRCRTGNGAAPPPHAPPPRVGEPNHPPPPPPPPTPGRPTSRAPPRGRRTRR